MITTHKLEQNKEEETKMKKLYEIIQEYESAGVKNHDLTLMKNLSRAKICSISRKTSLREKI